ncbi:CDP-glycerol glycerophosphotransferase family protein [Anaerobiospirillum thomasii]|uniref:CDP-glycerol:poly(Glycerophosphate) glycerophosphotransferase n=1 Tax=Anaerobiospirillum thomasii TaxID=179995 RepID=A0A2X0V8S9_9GAMM|nr:CDP-glycerol glycerophosphotransferase family protein [Anaerobiospirillum thomasii]SPT70874.1 CDP-glycerol:poly(glycerophosphate) glycerophosphotransferase [Anaerobiospirillum thomasii]
MILGSIKKLLGIKSKRNVNNYNGVNEFCEIYKNYRKSNEEYTKVIKNQNQNNKFSLVVLCNQSVKAYDSIKSIKSIIENDDINVFLIIEKKLFKDKEFNNCFEKLASLENLSYVLYSELDDRVINIIGELSETLKTEYVLTITQFDSIAIRNFKLLVTKFIDKNENDLKHYPVCVNCDINKIDSTINGYSTIVIRKEFLKLLRNTNYNYFFRFFLCELKGLKHIRCSYFPVRHRTSNTMSYASFACFVRESISLLSSDQNLNIINYIYNSIEKYFDCSGSNIQKKGIAASASALIMTSIYNKVESEIFEDLCERFSKIFLFDKYLKNQKIQIIHNYLLKQLIPVEPGTIGIIETRYMNDLDGPFLNALRKSYKVLYIDKPQYFNYHYFYCMVVSAYLQPANIILTSNSIHKFMTTDKKVITLWHGLGMLKKIMPIDKKKYRQDILVCSSEDCVEKWSQSFGIDSSKILPLGNIQTDILYKKEYIEDTRDKFFRKYPEFKNKTIALFAPTFRKGDEFYYEFKMDIEELSQKLMSKNIVLVMKKHHVFTHILNDTGIDKSGLYTSENRHCIVEDSFIFQELIAVADVFITDYSSAIFYAAVRNLPIVLYATDIEEYCHGNNGFICKYPDEIPAEVVNYPDSDIFVESILSSHNLVNTVKYEEFKKKHIGMCDGHATDRVINYIRETINE